MIEAATRRSSPRLCAFVIDDAHHADRQTAELIDSLAQCVRTDQRLLVLARRLPPEPNACDGPSSATCRRPTSRCVPTRFGNSAAVGLDSTVNEAAVEALHAATGGWTAATVLSAARARRTGGARLDSPGNGRAQHGQDAVATILDEAVSALAERDLQRLAQVARLVPTDRLTLDAVAGEDFLERALAAGVPLAPVGEGRWDLPGPVREFLTTLAPADVATLSAASSGLTSPAATRLRPSSCC